MNRFINKVSINKPNAKGVESTSPVMTGLRISAKTPAAITPSKISTATRIQPVGQKELTKRKPELAARKGVSLPFLLKSTPDIYKERANSVKINKVVFKKEDDGRILVKASIAGKKGNYLTEINGITPGSFKDNKTKVKVSCSCSHFKYYCEYALNKVGAADIRYSNGEPPVEKNPQMVPMMCKHLVKLALTVIPRL